MLHRLAHSAAIANTDTDKQRYMNCLDRTIHSLLEVAFKWQAATVSAEEQQYLLQTSCAVVREVLVSPAPSGHHYKGNDVMQLVRSMAESLLRTKQQPAVQAVMASV